MSEKRFVIDHSYLVNYDKYCILDKVQHKHMYLDEICKKLNEQQATIQKQSERIRELESILADDIVRRYEIKDAWKQRTEKRWNDDYDNRY